MDDIEKIDGMLWKREMALQCAKIALNQYKETQNPVFYEYAKWFGEKSVELKNGLGGYVA